MNFDLRSPCTHCPFRSDIRPFLTKSRVREIIHQITAGQATFSCHKTVDYGAENMDETRAEGPFPPSVNEQHCAGALIMLERMNRPNQMMGISERLGGYDRTKLKMDAPVFKTPALMINAQRK